MVGRDVNAAGLTGSEDSAKDSSAYVWRTMGPSTCSDLMLSKDILVVLEVSARLRHCLKLS